ncbi:hypothetical protein [Pseudomonas japonica]|uniref:hypothetical protein n=1 Tax=Pseudomonas japonica TaxID=256466 RepID=UPI003A8C5D99
MPIKNFVVITQRINERCSGLIAYVNYLRNPKASSHARSEILSLPKANADEFLKKTLINTVNFDNKNTKGGRKVESYAQSFNFVLPPDVLRPSIEQWRLIYRDIIITARDSLGLSGVNCNHFAEHCFANIHDQSNPHLNLVIPRIYGKDRLDKLDQKRLLSNLKKSFNASVLKHCNIDFKDYKPKRQNLGRRRKIWQDAQENYETIKKEITREQIILENNTTLASLAEEAAKNAKFEAQQAVEESRIAKAEADQSERNAAAALELLAEMRGLLAQFQEEFAAWVESCLLKNTACMKEEESKLLNTIRTMQSHPGYDSSLEDIIYLLVERTGIDSAAGNLTSQLPRRKFKN